MPTSSRLQNAGTTILVVEDEPAVLRVTARLLMQFGYRVIQATHGAQALELARSSAVTIDLMLTDVLMPDMNGVELAAAIRQILPDVRVLYMSGYTGDALNETHANDSPTLLVQKPFTRDVIAQAIRQALRGE